MTLARRLEAAFFAAGDAPVEMHSHDRLELVMILDGEVVTDCGGVELRAGPGRLLLMPAGMLHDQRSDGFWRSACLLLAPGLLPGEETPRQVDLGDDPLPRRWIEDLCTLRTGLAPDAEPLSDLLLSVLLARVSRMIAAPDRPLHPALAAAVAVLHARLAAPVSRAELAEAACLSAGHLAALFLERYGVGPLRFQQRLRLQKAARLLENPYLALDDIARQCGYDDVSYFARLFRREYGLPPGRWRAERRFSACPPG